MSVSWPGSGGGRCVQAGRNGTCKGPEAERNLGFLRIPARRPDVQLEVPWFREVV